MGRPGPSLVRGATPLWNDVDMDTERTSTDTAAWSRATGFTELARVLAQNVALMGLVVPGFRTPPRTVGVDRTIRRSCDGEGGVVAVRLADRPLAVVIGDMIEGVIVLNRLPFAEADRVRTHLWRTMSTFAVESAPVGRRDRSLPRVA